MKEYVFTWALEPTGVVTDEFSLDSGGPLIVSIKRDRIEIRAYAAENEKDRLQREATALATNLVTMLAVQYRAATSLGAPVAEIYHIEPASLRKDVEISVRGARCVAMAGTIDFIVRDANGNVIDSSVLQREEQRRLTRRRIIHLAARACDDPVLREMLQYRSQYEADPLGRLHHLYDILQVAERVYGGRGNAAKALQLAEDDLSELGRIANDETLTNSRHPGKSPNHHPASAAESATCERVADAIIDAQALDDKAYSKAFAAN